MQELAAIEDAAHACVPDFRTSKRSKLINFLFLVLFESILHARSISDVSVLSGIAHEAHSTQSTREIGLDPPSRRCSNQASTN